MRSVNEAVWGEFAEQYLEAMQKEISSLIIHKAWKTVPQSEANMLLS